MKIKLARLSGQLTHRNHHTRVLAGLGTCYNILISTAIPEGCSQTLADSGTLSRFDFFKKNQKKNQILMWKALKCWELIQIRVIFKELYGLIWGGKIPKLEKIPRSTAYYDGQISFNFWGSWASPWFLSTPFYLLTVCSVTCLSLSPPSYSNEASWEKRFWGFSLSEVRVGAIPSWQTSRTNIRKPRSIC